MASAVIAVLVIAGFMIPSLIGGGGSGSRVRTGGSSEYVAGIGFQHPLMPGTYPDAHVFDNETVSYSTTPPTTGKHWNRWADCGFYEEGLPDERITHNLEHGIVVVSYNLATAEEVSQLRVALESIDFYEDWGLTRFYDEVPQGTIALAAWGVLDTVEGIDRDRMNRFFSTYAGNLGPEQIPCGFSHLGVG